MNVLEIVEMEADDLEVTLINSLLLTRLQRPPVAPDIFPRARLLERLKEGRRRTLSYLRRGKFGLSIGTDQAWEQTK